MYTTHVSLRLQEGRGLGLAEGREGAVVVQDLDRVLDGYCIMLQYCMLYYIIS